IPSLGTLIYNGPGKIEYGKPESDSPKFEATIEPIATGPYAKLIVTAKPPLETGENRAKIHIKTNVKEQPELDVPVLFVLPPRVEVAPSEVLLSPSARIQSARVVIHNNGDKSFSVLGVKVSNDKIHWQFYPSQDISTYQLMLNLPPADAAGGTPA